ncbi:MAG: YfhO family protein [Bacteroidales bacterium]|nr:YfhO family protein [Bacteroidales bacterium]
MKTKNTIVKKIAVILGIIVLFLALSYGFVPQVLEGKIVNQSDISGYVGMAEEMNQWNKAHPDDPAYWSDSMFGGMPTTAISAPRKGDLTQPLYDLLLTGKRPATYLFVTLLGAFLLFLALGVSWPVAIGGAIAVAFCSYNFQIIQVGHNTKMQAIAFMPWVLAALVYTYRDARSGSGMTKILGATLFGLALSMQIKANHQQITYYLAIMVLLYALAEFIHTFRTKEWKHFWIASALLLVLGGAGIATNVNKLLPLAKYTPHTMRGGSELSKEGANANGLDLDYATAWSYGWEELPNMLIPNFNGGASSGAVNPDKSETIALLKKYGQKNLRETAKSLPLYWGPQPFTAGPMYMGAVAIFLFVLGLGLYKGREKWWLLAATIIAILMAVGNHFMAFTAFCFKYLPLYNKFRTVSMALVVLQVSLPVLGFLTLDRIVRQEYDRKTFMKAFWWALGITGGFCLLAWLAPGMFGSFSGASDAQMQDVLVDALIADRIALFRQDAGVSLLLILLSAGALLWAYLPKGPANRRVIAAVGIGLLSLLNLFVVGKRYLNADDFTTPKDFKKPFAERPVDQAILADKDPQYRVLDLTVNVFNSSVPSYRHKNIGGYSPAKLQRYQDLIDHYLAAEINGIYKALNEAESFDDVSDYMASSTPVLNALNMRYLIVDGKYPPVENYAAFGPAWFVDSVVQAATADEEIALLGSVDLHTTAVADARSVSGMTGGVIPGIATIEMTSYTPNEVRYRYTAENARVAVFSEIFYPGWKAAVDGEPLDLFRADWTLRGALLPAGEHEVVMRFAPSSYKTGATVSLVASLLLLLMLLLALIGAAANTKKPKNV